ncbi:MAG: DUF1559 domain-containing protein, partial [Candidatus Brocadiia bacterium]
AMLMPALEDARDRARRVVCMNNIKQQGLAYSGYAMDFNEGLPLMRVDRPCLLTSDTQWDQLKSYTGGAHVWLCPDYYRPYLNDPDKYGQKGGGYAMQGYGDMSPWCTADPDCAYRGHANAGSCGYFGRNSWASWCNSSNLNPWRRADVAVAINLNSPLHPSGCSKDWVNGLYGLYSPSWRLNDIPAPSLVTLRTEAYPAYGGWPGWDGRTFAGLGGNVRHAGTAAHPQGGNCLFADGHAKWGDQWGPATWSGQIGFSWHHSVMAAPEAPAALRDREPTW